MVVLTRCRIDSLHQIPDPCQELVECHPILVVEVCGREMFLEPIVNDAILVW